MTNQLFFGDNFDVLRDHIASERVDLIYLDPPFNSNANYNILFKSKTGDGADALDAASVKRAKREDMPGSQHQLL